MWHGVPFACQRRPIIGVLRMCWLLPGSFDCFCCPHTSVHRPSIACLAVFLCGPGALSPPPSIRELSVWYEGLSLHGNCAYCLDLSCGVHTAGTVASSHSVTNGPLDPMVLWATDQPIFSLRHVLGAACATVHEHRLPSGCHRAGMPLVGPGCSPQPPLQARENMGESVLWGGGGGRGGMQQQTFWSASHGGRLVLRGHALKLTPPEPLLGPRPGAVGRGVRSGATGPQ